jgi:hypothetical protein
MEPHDHLPDELARHTGRYDELNVFGTHTGRTIEAERAAIAADRLHVAACPRTRLTGCAGDTRLSGEVHGREMLEATLGSPPRREDQLDAGGPESAMACS